MNWTFDKIRLRAVCFKSGGGGAERIITEDMQASAEVAAQQWNDYQEVFVPFEDAFIKDMTSRDDTEQLQGMVAADVAQKTGVTQVDPTRPNVQANIGRATAAGMVDARSGATDRKAQGMGAVVAMGRGQQVEAMQGLTDQAITSGTIAAEKAIADRKAETIDRGTTLGATGRVVGAAGGMAANYKPADPNFSMAPTVGPTVGSTSPGQSHLNNTMAPLQRYNSTAVKW